MPLMPLTCPAMPTLCHFPSLLGEPLELLLRRLEEFFQPRHHQELGPVPRAHAAPVDGDPADSSSPTTFLTRTVAYERNGPGLNRAPSLITRCKRRTVGHTPQVQAGLCPHMGFEARAAEVTQHATLIFTYGAVLTYTYGRPKNPFENRAQGSLWPGVCSPWASS